MSFTPPKKLEMPVLFMVFNRLDTTQQVFEQIKLARPPRLYVAADGARVNREGELGKTQIVREYILNNIDWDCEVKTLFREKNLGCKMAVSSAITWFFEHEPQGIILEDDCKPCQSFFWFCEAMLNKYKDDKRVWLVSGDNFQEGVKRGDGDYYFSKLTHIWGWATWADRWQVYDVNLASFDRFKAQDGIKNVFSIDAEQNFWLETLQKVKDGKIDTWDYQWSYCVFSNNGLCVLPNQNLIQNIGFGVDATHTFDLESKLANMETHEMIFPIKHPSFILANKPADELTSERQFKPAPLLNKVLKKIRSRL